MTPWTVALQFPPPMGFSQQEYWSVLPFPSPESPPDSGIEPVSLESSVLQAEKAFQMNILNEMRAERTQHHSLESQVHRQNKGWIEGLSVLFLSFCFKDTL